jgi:hypothetical protein
MAGHVVSERNYERRNCFVCMSTAVRFGPSVHRRFLHYILPYRQNLVNRAVLATLCDLRTRTEMYSVIEEHRKVDAAG